MIIKKIIVSTITLMVLVTTTGASFANKHDFNIQKSPSHFVNNHNQIHPGSIYYKDYKNINNKDNKRNNNNNLFNKKRLAERFEMKERRNIYKRNYGHMNNKFAYKGYKNYHFRH